MRTLLIDNHDSYTYNLFQLMAAVYGEPPVVVANDDPALPGLDLDRFDAAVISPGPGHPAHRRDVGHGPLVLARRDLPVLGVCLGHQEIALVAGARVEPAPVPRHGHLARIHHRGEGLLAGVPPAFVAVRYHSLCVAGPLPARLEATARADDGVIMALRDRELPRWGVQFHPESICTEHGARIAENFRRLALAAPRLRRRGRPAPTGRSPAVPPGPAVPGAAPVPAGGLRTPSPRGTGGAGAAPGEPGGHHRRVVVTGRSRPALRVHVRRVGHEVDTGAAFERLHGTSTRAFWLDSARVGPEGGRFSFLGAADGPTGEVLSYRVGDGHVLVEPAEGPARREPGTIYEVLGARLDRTVEGAGSLPFDLAGGYVGYLGYEMKALSGSPNRHRAATPDALWLRADRFVAVDHARHETHVVAVAEPGAGDAAARWVDRVSAALGALPTPDPPGAVPEAPTADVARWLVRPRARYLADIATCRGHLQRGETYEICLTDRLRLPAPADDLAFYRRLRRLNPAPHAALLRAGDLAVHCSSPERFLRVGVDGTVESRPIKGTARRSRDPDLDERRRRALGRDDKARAENLMIVDLLRNDLGRVCEVGSVTVPRFLAVESYATVHQLVSTVRGVLRPGVAALDCVRACFPGGSMTGAPKLRTLELLDAIEGEARGVYSGTLGYLGFTGAADLNIVIRTAVRRGRELTVGAGGAIVLGSDPAAEYDEMLAKAEAPLRALPAGGDLAAAS